MLPLPALAFVLAGLAIALAAGPRVAWKRKASFAAAAGAGLLAVLSQATMLLGWRTTMPTLTAILCLAASGALLLPDAPRFRPPFHALAILTALIGWLGLGRYIFGGAALLPYSRMALLSALLAFAASAGLLCLRPESGLVGLLGSPHAGGVVTRRMLPVVVIFPIAFGWLRLQGQYAGLYGTEAGVSLFAVASIIAFGGLIWTTAARLDRADAQREEFIALVEQSEDLIAFAALDGRLAYLNSAGLGLAGLSSPDASPPAMLADLFTRADAMRHVAEGKTWSGETQVRSFSGAPPVHVSATLFPIRDQRTSRPLRIAAVVRDITSRKTAEAKLQEQLGRLDLLSRITRAIGERQDLGSIFQVVLQTLEDSYPVDFACGCTYDPLTGELTVTSVGARTLEAALAIGIAEKRGIPVDENGLSRSLRGELVYEPDIRNSPFLFPRRLASLGLHSFVAAPLFFDSRVSGLLIAARRRPGAFSSGDCEFLRQLSEHVALAAGQAQTFASLEKAYEDLRNTQSAVFQQERLAALGRMASGIAHDINNAISPIALYTDMLLARETGLSAEGRDDLKTVERAIQDVAHTVARMREFHRRDKADWTPVPVPLGDLIGHVVESTRARWRDMPQQRGLQVEVRLALADVPDVRGVEAEIRDALTNLVLNGVDAMPQGGTLTIATGMAASPTGRRVWVEVRDTGIGMDEQTKSRCLEPFFTTKGERGTGLGLAMVHGMLERHGGEIEIESKPGFGTAIRLLFPASTGSESRTRASAAGRSERPLRILVVDDDPLVRRAMREALATDGHAVVAADGGQEGIDTFHEFTARGERFDLVITDLGMPRVDGRRVVAAVKEASPATPVFLLTGWGNRLGGDPDAPARADLILGKPPRVADLREAIAGLPIC